MHKLRKVLPGVWRYAYIIKGDPHANPNSHHQPNTYFVAAVITVATATNYYLLYATNNYSTEQ